MDDELSIINTWIIVILCTVLIVLFFRNRAIEKFTDAEAVQNLASLYNSTNMKVTDMTLTGTANLNNLIVAGASNIPPSGAIIAYYPKNQTNWMYSIPAGWVVCDGTNGTPDLRGRFILGAGQGDKLTNRVLGATGGEEQTTLTVDQMPKHRHNLLILTSGGALPADSNVLPSTIWTKKGVWRNDSVQTTGGADETPEGGSNPHNNTPPFYVLVYLMKT